MSRHQELVDRIGRLSPRKLALLLARLSDEQGSKQQQGRLVLAAFVTASANQSLNMDDLRDSLRQLFPDYMLPSSFTLLDEFPLLPNGKIDVSALSVRKSNVAPPRQVQSTVHDTEHELVDIWCTVLQTDYVAVGDDFFEMGGDSILSIQLVSLAHQAGLKLMPNDLFDHPTITQLAAQLRLRKTKACGLQIPQSDSGQAPLTPIQHWFMNQALVSPGHWNQNLLLEIEAVLSAEMLNKAINALTLHHGALRTCFVHDHDRFYQQVASRFNLDFNVFNIAAEDDIDAVISDRAGAIQNGFSVDRAPLVRFMLFACAGKRPDRLLICAHHLVIDAVSWRILIEDFEQACRMVIRDETIVLATGSTSYQQWSLSLERFAQSPELQSELDYWKSLPLSETNTIPRDREGIDAVEGNADILTVTLDEKNTFALTGAVHSAYRTTVIDLLLTALARVLSRWTKRRRNSIGLEGHGREPLDVDIDTTRTMGWFTAFYPVCIEVGKQGDMATDVKHIKELIHRIPNRGIGYGLLRYLCDDGETRSVLETAPEPQLLFNYLGNTNQISPSALFRVLPVSCGPQRDGANRRAHLLDINVYISTGRLIMNWTYDRDIHDRETIMSLADDYSHTLKQLINHCLDPHIGGYTPSDFPDAGLDQGDLDAFIDKLS